MKKINNLNCNCFCRREKERVIGDWKFSYQTYKASWPQTHPEPWDSFCFTEPGFVSDIHGKEVSPVTVGNYDFIWKQEKEKGKIYGNALKLYPSSVLGKLSRFLASKFSKFVVIVLKLKTSLSN